MKPTKIKRSLQSIVISLAVHAGLFLGAGSIVVYSYIKPPAMMFQPAKKKPKLAARALEHSIRVKQCEQQSRRPKILNKLITKGRSPLSLPALPPITPVSTDARRLPSLTKPVGAQLGLPGLSGFGAGTHKAGFAGFSETEIFGHAIKTRSIVILVDSSSSIVKKGVFEAVRNEAIRMVDRFHPDTGFNVILFADGAFAFNAAIVYATRPVKDEFKSWMNAEMKINRGNNPATSGSSPIIALQTALQLEPDTIILITDDPPYLQGIDPDKHCKEILDMVRRHRNESQTKVTINTVAYKPHSSGSAANVEKGKQARDFLQKLARISGGTYREIKE